MFFKRFKKKLRNKEINISKKKYKFGLNFRKKFLWAVVGINLLLLGSFYFYKNMENGSRFMALVSILIIFFGLSFLYMIFEYKIVIDLENRKILYKKVEIELDNIKKVTLKHMLPPGMKTPTTSLEIITNDKIRIIIPLIMHKNVDFAAIVQKTLENRFHIDKTTD
ncbi:MAG: hypothetical protein ACQERZ_01110 [Fusobacteriota bacterium]